ncbi:hypothetical protein [Anaeromassilibacillus senegalensis]|uniref:hypothetical protein n=1 Tax=Anaeromassilibacillus senegalensis TaxID=1673717 RepID=UPI00068079B4|nr:hypothetical protein [Anaeromassilibacillus senegalensis]
MKKIVLAWMMAICMAGVLVGCVWTVNQVPEESPPPSQTAESSSSEEAPVSSEESTVPEETPSAPEETAAEGAAANQLIPEPELSKGLTLPAFLNGDQQLLYQAAYRMYFHFSMTSGFEPDMEAEGEENGNGRVYYPDRGFDSYADYRKAMESVFTVEYTDFLNESQCYIDDGAGGLLTAPGDRGSDITYKETTFELVKQDENEVEFNLIGHYNDALPESSGDPADDTTVSFAIKMVNTENGWRFDSFAIPY